MGHNPALIALCAIVAWPVVYESPQSTCAGRWERPQSTGTPVEKAPIGRAAAVAARRTCKQSDGVSLRAVAVSLSQLAPCVHQFANCHRAHPAAVRYYTSETDTLLTNAQFPGETGRPTSRVEFNSLTVNDRWHRIHRSQQRSLSLGIKG